VLGAGGGALVRALGRGAIAASLLGEAFRVGWPILGRLAGRVVAPKNSDSEGIFGTTRDAASKIDLGLSGFPASDPRG
jgi:hypothetical protein